MKKGFLSASLAFFLFSIALAQDDIEISLKHNNNREKQTSDQLRRILKQYNLSKWLFTKQVLIEFRALPHSHPVPTINTLYLDNDIRFLSMFIHEQIYWFTSNKFAQTSKAMEELKTLYPNAPDGPPEGAKDKQSTYLLLVVCYLEYEAMKELVGDEKARGLTEQMSVEFYKWIYRTILTDDEKIRRIVEKHNLKI
jgi:hypothetical protein